MDTKYFIEAIENAMSENDACDWNAVINIAGNFYNNVKSIARMEQIFENNEVTDINYCGRMSCAGQDGISIRIGMNAWDGTGGRIGHIYWLTESERLKCEWEDEKNYDEDNDEDIDDEKAETTEQTSASA